MYIIAIVTDTAQWYWCAVDTTAPLPNAVQGGDGQWVVGRVGAALEDKREYQQMLSEGWRRKVEGSSDQLREVRHKVPSDNTIGGYTTSHINNYSWREPGRLSSDK